MAFNSLGWSLGLLVNVACTVSYEQVANCLCKVFKSSPMLFLVPPGTSMDHPFCYLFFSTRDTARKFKTALARKKNVVYSV